MNLEAEILKEHSKRQAVKIGMWVGSDRRRFEQLMKLFLHGEYRVTQRAVWIVSYCGDHHPELIGPWLKLMLEKMREPGVHDAVKRNVVRILETIDVPRSLQGLVATQCFDFLGSFDAPIAVKVHSMSVLANIAERERDLGRELRAVIEQMMPFVGAALQARGRHVLKQLARIEKR